MSSVSTRIASGAVWMLLLKLLERGMGLVSTIILARLLVPADFGLVAMATSVIAVLDLLTAFSFDVALIQKQDVERRHYDAAWTLNVCIYAVMAFLMVLLAPIAASYYREQRVEGVMYALSIGVFITGLENIGTVAFRKQLVFEKEFRFLLVKKLSGVVVGLSVALVFRSYWALIAGMVTGRIAGVTVSYLVHPFRPRPSFAGALDLMHFSKWLFAYGVAGSISGRAPDFVIGRIAGPDQLGIYNIGAELSNLPTTELVMPINRAAWPGYAVLSAQPEQLRHTFLHVLSATLLLVLPAGAGLGLLAKPLVNVVLGDKWIEVTPVIQWLAVNGVVNAFLINARDLLVACGRTSIIVWITLISSAILIPFLVLGTRTHGIMGAAWAVLLASSLVLPIAYAVVRRLLVATHMDFLNISWRPLLGTAVMAVVVSAWQKQIPEGYGTAFQVIELLSSSTVGAVSYAFAVAGLWWVAGRPAGVETLVLREAKRRCREYVSVRWG